ncbi:hypothetical protein BH09ACT8_BH09ACT8_48280 [soil metagenome]
MDSLRPDAKIVTVTGASSSLGATHETPEQSHSAIDANLTETYRIAQACGRVMQPDSAIVNIASLLNITTSE